MHVRCLHVVAIVVGATSLAHAQFFARSDDTRSAPPEQRTLPKDYFVDIQAGAEYDRGNVRHVGVHGTANLGLRLTEHDQVFVDVASDHEVFDGKVNLDKDKGALLYVHNLGEHWNVFAESTHVRNRFLELTYRTSQTGGLCLHSFAPDFKIILLSLGLTPEAEWWDDGTHDTRLRATGRLNFVYPLSATAALGGDVIYTPRLADPHDFRWFGQTFVELRLTPEVFSVRVLLFDEYDSRPRPGVQRNDVTLIPTLVAHLKN